MGDKYIITISAKEKMEEYGIDEWELLDSQLEKIEEENITDGFFVKKVEYSGEVILCVATGLIQGEIIQTVTCVQEELQMIHDIMLQIVRKKLLEAK